MAHSYTPSIQRAEDYAFKPILDYSLSDGNKMSCMEIILPQSDSVFCSAGNSLTDAGAQTDFE